MEEQITLEEIVVLVRQLSLEDRVRLLEVMTRAIEREARVGQPIRKKRQQNREHAPANDGYMDSPYDPGEAWRTFTYNEVN